MIHTNCTEELKLKVYFIISVHRVHRCYRDSFCDILNSFLCNLDLSFQVLFQLSNIGKRVLAQTLYFQARRQLSDMSSNWALFTNAKQTELYAQYRPRYTEQVFKTIIDYCGETSSDFHLAVDVGCGSGQSTEPLAKHFRRVWYCNEYMLNSITIVYVLSMRCILALIFNIVILVQLRFNSEIKKKFL